MRRPNASASLGKLFSPALDVLTRLWLAQGFLLTDVMQHMVPGSHAAPHGAPPLLTGIAGTGLGTAIQTVCPVLLAAGLLTRAAAAALLVQVLVLRMPGHALLASYSVALLGWVIVLGPGPLSLDGMLRSGIGAAALPLTRLASQTLAALTRRLGPTYTLILRLWIATAPAVIALGAVQGLDSVPPGGMMSGWLPRMPGMTAGIAPWLLLALAASLALGLLTRLSVLVLILLIPASQIMVSSGHLGWLLLLNLPLLGLPLLYGPGAFSLDHALAAALRRRFPPFEALPPAAAGRSLAALGVEVLTGCKVEAIDTGGATIAGERVAARSIV